MLTSASAMHEARQTLARTIIDLTKVDGDHETAIPGLLFCRRSTISIPAVSMYEPCICVLGQGAKRVIAGEEVHDYDESQYLLTSIDLPTVTTVSKASAEEPCVGLMFKLDLRLMSQMLLEPSLPEARAEFPRNSMSIGTLTPQLLDPLRRLVGLLETPNHIPVLLPLLEREILYWLLIGEHGYRLRQLAMSGSKTNQIAKAADWLRAHYVEPLCVSQLAKKVNMSISSFHHHFRVIMSMSPLQYQKQLRLHEARRLMLTDTIEAAAAALTVGYESHTQFNREYKRLFGAPPIRDIARLREAGQFPSRTEVRRGGGADHEVLGAVESSTSFKRRSVLSPIMSGRTTSADDLQVQSKWDFARFWNARYSEELLVGGLTGHPA